MIAPFGDVQRAFYEVLTAALAPVPVLDDHPTNELFPYITIGVLNSLPDECLIEQGAEIGMQVDVWSIQPGMQETQYLMSSIIEALQHRKLILQGDQWVDTRWEMGDVIRDPDGRTRHGVLRFNVSTWAGRGDVPLETTSVNGELVPGSLTVNGQPVLSRI